MPTITFTVTAADAARVTAAAVGYGFPDAKSMVIQQVKDSVVAWETQQAERAIVPLSPVTPT